MSCSRRGLRREVQGVAKAAVGKAAGRGRARARATTLAFRVEKAKAAENAPSGQSDYKRPSEKHNTPVRGSPSTGV